MKPALSIPIVLGLVSVLTNCGTDGGGSAGQQANTGPFDSRGNYVEEWADNPSKWRKAGGGASPHERRSDQLPEIAKNDEPPQNSVPLPPANVSKPAPTISQTQVTSQAKPVVTKTEPVIVRSKPKPVLVKAKPKVKPKPKSTRYVVKKGDSLSAIASRTGSSVSAIKSANGISGTVIRPGQSLSIPKR